MIYVEYITRDRFMPVDVFRRLGDQSSWTDERDQLVLNVGRTMRIGPHPAYMAFWRCSGMVRMDEWEAHFNSPAALADTAERAALIAIDLAHAGCFDEVFAGEPAAGGLQYIEFFDAPAGTEPAAIADHFQSRAAAHPEATLNHVVRRIGLLAPPELGDMAVWTVPDYVTLEPLARERHAAGPCRPRSAGVYRRFGKEIL